MHTCVVNGAFIRAQAEGGKAEERGGGHCPKTWGRRRKKVNLTRGDPPLNFQEGNVRGGNLRPKGEGISSKFGNQPKILPDKLSPWKSQGKYGTNCTLHTVQFMLHCTINVHCAVDFGVLYIIVNFCIIGTL